MGWPCSRQPLPHVSERDNKADEVRGSTDHQEFFEAGERVAVLTTQPLDRLLDYRAPEGGCFLGAYVEVPLGPRKVLGVIWGPGAGGFDSSKLR
jgi:primosomal protein N' (replication factor Y)